MEKLLKKAGYDAIHAYSGKEGIQLAKKYHPLAITLDIVMPNMDGWAVLNVLKADPELKMIPVIVASSNEDKNMGFSLGASDYLLKPIQANTLKNVISRFVHEKEVNVLVIDDEPSVRQLFGR